MRQENGLASGGFRLTLGYYRGGWGFADWIFADWRFTDGPLTNWCGLDNRLRMREVRSNRRSHQGQRRSANDYEFQHEAPVAIRDDRRINLYAHCRTTIRRIRK